MMRLIAETWFFIRWVFALLIDGKDNAEHSEFDGKGKQ